MTRTRIALTVGTLGLAAVLGLTACGAPASPTNPAPAGAELSAEADALQALGFDTGLAAAPAPSADAAGAVGGSQSVGKVPSSGAPQSAGPGRHRHPRVAARRYLRKNTLHGEITVQTKDGFRTIVVQRGTVAAVTPTTVQVRSTDGYTLTWTFGDKLRVVQDRKVVPPTTLKNGQQIGVAGAKAGSATNARLIVIV